MTKRLYLFIAWCILLAGAAAAMSYYAMSPFSDGSRRSSSGYFYGPTHK
jgi:hypothetical protein